eukprot:9509-Heterococcus_DN1.PRE.1
MPQGATVAHCSYYLRWGKVHHNLNAVIQHTYVLHMRQRRNNSGCILLARSPFNIELALRRDEGLMMQHHCNCYCRVQAFIFRA